jgi:5'-phosphate synthase pdxT subunit
VNCCKREAGEVSAVGVLALQGDFEAHEGALRAAGAATIQVRRSSDLNGIDGLVIPGGESTTMLKLLEAEGMLEALREFGLAKPVFGTCAGAILMAREVTHPEQASLGLIDIGVERNAYGRQIHSRVAFIEAEPALRELCGERPIEGVFIRAPILRRLGEGVRVLARYRGDAVLVEQGRHLVATFHPELTGDTRIHELFLRRFVG